MREHVIHVGLAEYARDPQASHCTKYRDRRAEQHAERQRPALVLRSEDQEDENQRHDEDDGSRTLCGLFLVRHIGPGVADVGRQGGGGHLLQGIECLRRTVARFRLAGYFSRAEEIEAVSKFRSLRTFRSDQGGQRHHIAFAVPHMEHADAAFIVAVLRFRHHIDLVKPAKAVEVVDVGAAQESTDGGIDVGKTDTLLQRLGFVDVEKHLRHAGAVERLGTGNLGSLGCCRRERRHLFGEIFR